MTLCGQATLPDHHRVLVWEWLTRWPLDPSTLMVEHEDKVVAIGDRTLCNFEQELMEKILCPSPFDSYGEFIGATYTVLLRPLLELSL